MGISRFHGMNWAQWSMTTIIIIIIRESQMVQYNNDNRLQNRIVVVPNINRNHSFFFNLKKHKFIFDDYQKGNCFSYMHLR